MPQGKYYDSKPKEEVLEQIKTSGKPVAQIAREYGIIPKTVYNWLRSGVPKSNPILEINRLRRQNDELIKRVGELTFDLKKKR
jgi:transposase-like protein